MKQILFTILTILAAITPFAHAADFSGGSGTKQDPFLISTADELNNVRKYLGTAHTNKHFLLINDIDLGVPPYNQGEGWEPIGEEPNPFCGNFYGHDKKYCRSGAIIKNLMINRAKSYQGLFGVIGSNAAIIDIGLENCNVKATGSYIGGLIGGQTQGNNISNCYVTGNIQGGSHVGGLVGGSSSPLINCYAICNVSGNNAVGVLIGTGNHSSGNDTKNCYAIGSLVGNQKVGVIVGFGSGLSNCVAAGVKLSSTSNIDVHRVIGGGDWQNNTNNYALNTITINGSTVTGGTTNNGNGENKTLAELQTQSFYENTLGWDFDNTWVIKNPGEFPTFQWQYEKNKNDSMYVMGTLDFGECKIGILQDRTMQIMNKNSYSMTINYEDVYIAFKKNFTVSANQFPLIIAPGDSASIRIHYLPLNATGKTPVDYDTLTIGEVNPCEGNGLRIYLSGIPLADTLQIITKCDVPIRLVADSVSTDVVIYPNPSASTVTIENGNNIINKISLFDITGVLLAYYENINANKYILDLSPYQSGTYTLDIDGEVVRFVKK